MPSFRCCPEDPGASKGRAAYHPYPLASAAADLRVDYFTFNKDYLDFSRDLDFNKN